MLHKEWFFYFVTGEFKEILSSNLIFANLSPQRNTQGCWKEPPVEYYEYVVHTEEGYIMLLP